MVEVQNVENRTPETAIAEVLDLGRFYPTTGPIELVEDYDVWIKDIAAATTIVTPGKCQDWNIADASRYGAVVVGVANSGERCECDIAAGKIAIVVVSEATDGTWPLFKEPLQTLEGMLASGELAAVFVVLKNDVRQVVGAAELRNLLAWIGPWPEREDDDPI